MLESINFKNEVTYKLNSMTIKANYDASINSIKPTEFGVKICKILSSEALNYLNTYIEIIDQIRYSFKVRKKKELRSFFEIISEVFEKGIIEKTIQYEIDINRKGTYIFKVSLSNSVWRTVKLSHNHTLHNLHNIIQRAFEFDNDHLYFFYTGASHRSGKEIYSGNPMGVSDEYEDLTIDFIENEEFDSSPEIIDSKGESPQQYPDWD